MMAGRSRRRFKKEAWRYKPAEERHVTKSRAFHAQYSGQKCWCGDVIEQGQSVVYYQNVLMHEECAGTGGPGEWV